MSKKKQIHLSILFKSGAKETYKVSDWSANKTGSELVSFSWQQPTSEKKALRHVNINEIAAVWEE